MTVRASATRRGCFHGQESSCPKLPVATLGVRRICPPAGDAVTCCRKPELRKSNTWYFSVPPKGQRNKVKLSVPSAPSTCHVSRRASVSSANAFEASLTNRVSRFNNRTGGDLKIPRIRRADFGRYSVQSPITSKLDLESDDLGIFVTRGLDLAATW